MEEVLAQSYLCGKDTETPAYRVHSKCRRSGSDLMRIELVDQYGNFPLLIPHCETQRWKYDGVEFLSFIRDSKACQLMLLN